MRIWMPWIKIFPCSWAKYHKCWTCCRNSRKFPGVWLATSVDWHSSLWCFQKASWEVNLVSKIQLLPTTKWDFLCFLSFLRLGIMPHPRNASPRHRICVSMNRRSKIKRFTVTFISSLSTLGSLTDSYTGERQKAPVRLLKPQNLLHIWFYRCHGDKKKGPRNRLSFILSVQQSKTGMGQENDSAGNNWGKQCNSEGCFCCQRLTMDQLHVLIMSSVCGKE